MHSGPFTMLPPERHFQEAVSISEQGWHLESPTISPNRALCTHLYLTAGVSVPQGSGLPAGGVQMLSTLSGAKEDTVATRSPNLAAPDCGCPSLTTQ